MGPGSASRDVATLRPRSAAPGPTGAGKTCAFRELSPGAGARAGILIVAEVEGWLSPITRASNSRNLLAVPSLDEPESIQ